MSEIYKTITDKILAQLDAGTVPWKKDWDAQKLGFAKNVVSGDPYQGTNFLMLNFIEQYQSPLWMTYKQAQDLGGTVRKGEHSSKVIYFKLLEKTDRAGNLVKNSNGETARIPMIRYANVFNHSQTEGVPVPEKFQKLIPNDTRTPIQRADEIIQKFPIGIKHGFTGASFHPQADHIEMPNQATFSTPEHYYHTLFHEMTHATGHPKRLNRDLSGKYGSASYAKEELIAEIGSCFLAAEAGLDKTIPLENSASYIDHWRKELSKDPKLIVQAASEAQKSTNFILGRGFKSEADPCIESEKPGVKPLKWIDAPVRDSKQIRKMSL